MKANELMMGDWVIVYEKSMPAKAKVEGVYGKTVTVLGHQRIVEKYFVEPIPITPEILEKNGFVYNAIPFADGWEQFGLTLYRGGNGYRIDCGINVSLIIDSVHELQHALRLCGIEKEIEL